LTIDAWEDVKCELFWPFNDDMFTSWIPANHVVVFGTLKKAVDDSEIIKEKKVVFTRKVLSKM
jgi:hypothetical protein